MSTPASMSQQEVLDAYQASIQHTYGKTPIVFVRGEGAQLWDSEGRRYLDFVSGGRAGFREFGSSAGAKPACSSYGTK